MVENMIFIISGVSGAGKGTVINGVLKSGKFNLARGINVTTRPREARDTNEPHFQYVSIEEFKKMIKAGELLEYDYHHQNYYGTNRLVLEELLKESNILMEADVNGAMEIKKKMSRCPANGGDAGSRTRTSGENVILIYIVVELMNIRNRLQKRDNETEEEIKLRMKRASLENKRGKDYDYNIENPEGHPEKAINEVLAIIEKELKKKEN